MSSKSNQPLVSPEVLKRLPSEAVEIILKILERIEELERRLGMTPKKSKSKKKRGGQKGHKNWGSSPLVIRRDISSLSCTLSHIHQLICRYERRRKGKVEMRRDEIALTFRPACNTEG